MNRIHLAGTALLLAATQAVAQQKDTRAKLALPTSDAAPLPFAAAAGNADAVSALLDKGALPNAKEREWGQTPLVFAAENDRADAIRALLKRGADPSIRTTAVNLTDEAAKEQ